MPDPKTVGVLTFHRCINYGSYWQARCLVEGLRRRGLSAVVMDHRSARAERAEWRCALSPLLPTPTPRTDFPAYAAKTRKFFAAFAGLPLSRPFRLDDPSDAGAFDAIVVGSDEVWNFRHPWYAACPAFFGEGLKADRLVAYAASFGCYESGPLDDDWAAKLRRFAAIAVRDEASRRLVREALAIDPPLALDPCLQFDEFCRSEAEGDGAAPLVVYGHSFPGWFAQAVRRWADRRGLRLLSLGYRNDWADEQRLDAGPEEFAHAMADARAVATNFFHGCIFAVVNNKPFVTTPSSYRASKISGLAQLLGAERRIVSEATPHSDYEALLDGGLDPQIRSRLEGLRSQSNVYLDHALA